MSRIKPEVEINYICHIIDKNINAYSKIKDRELLSENILSQLRNLTEDIAIYIYNKENNQNFDCHYEHVAISMDYVSSVRKYKYIYEFHQFLQSTVSHYTPREEDAVRLMLYYFRYLYMFKSTLKSEYSLNILNELDNFPIYEDRLTKEHYAEICKRIESVKDLTNKSLRRGRFYVTKCRPIYSAGRLYYEVTLTKATDYVNKFERILMYSKHYIPDNYSIKLSYITKEVKLFSSKSKIKVIDNYVLSIRPCELKNIGRLIGEELQINDDYNEYTNLMRLLKQEDMSLLDLLICNKIDYDKYLLDIRDNSRNNNVSKLLESLRNRLLSNLPGNNLLRYLLTKTDNVVIKDQYQDDSNCNIGGLYVKNSSIPFDSMPYAMSLYRHNTSWNHLIHAIDCSDREHELLGKQIKDNAEIYNKLYTDVSDVEWLGDVDKLIIKYNNDLIRYHIDPGEKNIIVKENNMLYIKSYEKNSIDIINDLKSYLIEPDSDLYRNYINNVHNYPLDELTYDKKEIVGQLFNSNSIAFIHGPAGTGKTKMLEVLTLAFKEYDKIYISNTNTSVENLRRRISFYDNFNSYFETTSAFIKNDINEYDILIIDEGSTVSNEEMIKILKKQRYKLIIVSGDVYQIESIKYGNWFALSYNIFKNDFVYELIKTNRTEDENLLDLWKWVRDNDERAYNVICNQEYSELPSEKILHRTCDDEIVLCLNYDGLFGINNINKLLQEKNQNKEFNIGVDTYKEGDPIVFNDCPRFSSLYNNLKGIIKKIELDDENDRVWFTILVYDTVYGEPFKYDVLEHINGNSLIKFYVSNFKDTNEDENGYEHIIPFNLSYAISIHKAQGLEYESVKIVITSNVEDDITKNIFYTAITRTKKYLKIFWSSESQKKIFDQMKNRNNSRDISILKQKLTNQSHSRK